MMAPFDAEGLSELTVLIGLLTRDQARSAREEAENGSVEAYCKVLLRKGFLTNWQLDRLLKGGTNGFFFGGCKVLFHIAEGTFARVYRGIKEPGQQSVAIKVLRKRFTSDPASVKQFYHEAEAGVKLNHPSIVRIYDYGEEDKQYYMVMEYVEGMNLRDFLKRRHRLGLHDALPMMIQLAEGLKYSLDLGITHRDIKATNVLISNRGEAKLVDFGLATIETDEKKMERAHGVRTVDYSALERTCKSVKGDPRSDIFFLGCVFYQMLTGVPPMPEVEHHDPLVKMLRRNINAIKPISDHSHAPSPGICQVIEKMMKIDLKQRYQSMEEVVADLKSFEQATLIEAQRQAQAQIHVEALASPHSAVIAADDEDDGFDMSLFENDAIVRKSVLCVEIQEPVQDVLRKTLKRMGYHVMLVRDAERAAERYNESPPDAVLFDFDGQGMEAFEAFRQMHEKSRDLDQRLFAVVLLGPRQHIHRGLVPKSEGIVVMSKPVRMKEIQAALSQLLPAS